MKILQINKFWHPKGGADTMAINTAKWLEQAGHEVARFGMKSEKNIDSKWNKYFIDEIDFGSADFSLSKAAHFIYSTQAKEKLKLLLKEFQPDAVHLHNFYHHLTTSILPILKSTGAKIIMTCHDYKIMCPNYKMLSHGEICEQCRYHNYYKAALNKCTKNSLPASLLLSTEAYFNWLGDRYKKNIDLLIAPSKFMQKKIKEWQVGIDSEFLLNAIDIKPLDQPAVKKDYLLYVGRLSEEKGIDLLEKVALKMPEQKFYIIGDGPYKINNNISNLKYLGRKNQEEVQQYLAQAKALIVPSKWYEVNSLVIPEAHALGTWVIAANTGSIDVINDGQNGWFFKMNNVNDLISKIKSLEIQKTSFQPFLHITANEYINKLLTFYPRR
ncbi:MAG: glycosyltransferase [Patescibacteria group bacterium]